MFLWILCNCCTSFYIGPIKDYDEIANQDKPTPEEVGGIQTSSSAWLVQFSHNYFGLSLDNKREILKQYGEVHIDILAHDIMIGTYSIIRYSGNHTQKHTQKIFKHNFSSICKCFLAIFLKIISEIWPVRLAPYTVWLALNLQSSLHDSYF